MANCLLLLVGLPPVGVAKHPTIHAAHVSLGLFLLNCSNARYGCGDTDRPLPVVV